LQCDISKYFDSINHEILFEILQRKISDKKALWLIKEILDSNNRETGKGIPIGNLTSQLFANVYLNELDQFMKRELKRRYYIRYMDDFLTFGESKQELWQVKEMVAGFLKRSLDLNLHPKKATVFPVSMGVEFLGYRVFNDYSVLRKSTARRFVKKLKIRKRCSERKAERCFDSFANFAKSARAWNFMKKTEQSFFPERREQRALAQANADLQILAQG